MHEHGVAQHDLKVKRIIVARNGVVKIIDFGSADVSRNTLTGERLNSTEDYVRTPITRAPEDHRK
jgi:serine/threonine protein kinase